MGWALTQYGWGPHEKKRQGLWPPPEARTFLPWSLQRGSADTLSSDFWLPELGGDLSLLF